MNNQPSGKLSLHAQNEPMYRGVAMHFSIEDRDGAIYVPALVDWVKVEPGQYHAPNLIVRGEDAEQIVDAITRAGYAQHPTDRSAGELAATKQHLADMRELVGLDRGGKRKLQVEQ